jgi:hypothetical protein
MFIAISSLHLPAINKSGGAAGSLTKSISTLVAIAEKLSYRDVSFPAY